MRESESNLTDKSHSLTRQGAGESDWAEFHHLRQRKMMSNESEEARKEYMKVEGKGKEKMSKLRPNTIYNTLNLETWDSNTGEKTGEHKSAYKHSGNRRMPK